MSHGLFRIMYGRDDKTRYLIDEISHRRAFNARDAMAHEMTERGLTREKVKTESIRESGEVGMITFNDGHVMIADLVRKEPETSEDRSEKDVMWWKP